MRVMKSEGGINWSLSSPIEWVGPGGWARNYERFSMSNMYEHYLVGMWQRLRSDGLPSLWEAGSWVWAFLKSMIVELHAFAIRDLIREEQVRLQWVDTKSNPADLLTKAVPSKALFDKFAKLIMGAVDDTAKVFLLSLKSVLVKERRRM